STQSDFKTLAFGFSYIGNDGGIDGRARNGPVQQQVGGVTDKVINTTIHPAIPDTKIDPKVERIGGFPFQILVPQLVWYVSSHILVPQKIINWVRAQCLQGLIRSDGCITGNPPTGA